jgi:hypothetical protein
MPTPRQLHKAILSHLPTLVLAPSDIATAAPETPHPPLQPLLIHDPATIIVADVLLVAVEIVAASAAAVLADCVGADKCVGSVTVEWDRYAFEALCEGRGVLC